MANKRTKYEIASQSVKRSKLETEHETAPTKLLIELHDDYLELIFRWLDLNDLMTMMKVEKRFHQPIEQTFIKKYRKKLTVTMFSSEIRTNSLVLRELPMIIPFFQCFGPSIAKLTAIFDKNYSDQCIAIEQSIVEYCVKLKELDLRLCRKGAFDDISKPFEKLEVLIFQHGYLGDTMSQFGKWFPKLQTLKMDNVTVLADQICIKGTVPFLEHLDIDVRMTPKKISRKNIDAAICLNPQLRSIRLKYDCKPSDLRFVSSKLKQLEKLHFQINPKDFKKGVTRPIQFKFLKQLVLEVYDKRGTVDDFPLVCDKLENLEVHCFAWQDVWFDFARTNNLTKLTLLQIFGLNGGPYIQFLIKIAANWPNLTEITISVDNVNSNEVVQFITACKHLQRLEISDNSDRWTEKYNELNLKIGNKWKIERMTTTNDLKYSIIREA